MARITIAEASDMVGKSRSTIFRAIEKGALSANRITEDGRNTYSIDTSELFRVWDHIDKGVQKVEQPQFADSLHIENQNLHEVDSSYGHIIKGLRAEKAQAIQEKELLTHELKDTKERLEEHRAQSHLLPTKDEAEALKAAHKKELKAKDEQLKQKIADFHAELEKRKTTEDEKRQLEGELLIRSRDAKEALMQKNAEENRNEQIMERGLFARLLNTKIDIVVD